MLPTCPISQPRGPVGTTALPPPSYSPLGHRDHANVPHLQTIKKRQAFSKLFSLSYFFLCVLIPRPFPLLCLAHWTWSWKLLSRAQRCRTPTQPPTNTGISGPSGDSASSLHQHITSSPLTWYHELDSILQHGDTAHPCGEGTTQSVGTRDFLKSMKAPFSCRVPTLNDAMAAFPRLNDSHRFLY